MNKINSDIQGTLSNNRHQKKPEMVSLDMGAKFIETEEALDDRFNTAEKRIEDGQQEYYTDPDGVPNK